MESILLVIGFLCLGFYIHTGIIFKRAFNLAKQRPDRKSSAELLLVNLAEPFIMGIWLIIQIVFFDFGSLIGSVEKDFSARYNFFIYYWPMVVLLIIVPLSVFIAMPRHPIGVTAKHSLATGGLRVLMVWLCFNFIANGITILIASGLSIWSFRLINQHIRTLIKQTPLAVVFDEQGLAIRSVTPVRE